MASSSPICGICVSSHVYKPAKVWCSECDQVLCVDCTQHHMFSNGTKNHITMPMSDYQKLPSFVLNISQSCQKHDAKFQFYCRKDECPCCEICIVENHKDCKNVAILKALAKTIKTSVQFKEAEQLCVELMEILDKIRQNRKKNLVDVSQQKQTVESQIREVRTKINNHLDKLQENLMKELTEEETKITRKTRELLISLDKREKDLTEYQTTLVNIKQYASNLQTLLAMKQIESDIETHDTYLQALVSSDSLNQTKLSYKINSIEKFGEVVVESKPCEVRFARRKDTHAMVANLRIIDDIQLNRKQKINVITFPGLIKYLMEDYITGCSFLSDGIMAFSSSTVHGVFFLDKDGADRFEIRKDIFNFGSTYCGIVYIKENNSVAMSYGSARCIAIIDMKSRKVKETISMHTSIYGMAVIGRALYYFAGRSGLKMLNLSDRSVHYIINRDMSGVRHVATYGDKLYYTNRDKHSVTCCDLQGKTQWEIQNKCVLQNPSGISLDNGGNVYVVRGCTNVMVISPDGKRLRQLFSDKDGMKHPLALDYDRSTNRLLVVNDNITAFLFDVTRGQ